MLFSYKFFTFSQLPNKFHNRKFQYINLKQTKIKTKPNKNQNKTFVKLKNSVKRRKGRRESDRQLRERERQIEKERDRAWVGHGCDLASARVRSQWCFRWRDLDGASGGTISLVLGCNLCGASSGAISAVLGCDEIDAIWGWEQWCDLGLGAVVLQAARSILLKESYLFKIAELTYD